MVNLLIKLAFPRFKMSRHLVAAGFLAGLVGVVGLPSSLLPHQIPLVTVAAIAQAEDFTAEEISQYASAVLEMDGYRTDAYTRIKDLLLTVNMDIGEVDVSCSNQNISGVPRSVRQDVEEILFGYCNLAREIVEGYGLSPQRFNEITSAHQHDNMLSEKIQQELIRLQEPE